MQHNTNIRGFIKKKLQEGKNDGDVRRRKLMDQDGEAKWKTAQEATGHTENEAPEKQKDGEMNFTAYDALNDGCKPPSCDLISKIHTKLLLWLWTWRR